MKRCATCNQTYTDDLLYCLADGTPLVGMLEDAEQQTVMRRTSAGETAPPATSGSGNSVLKYVIAAVALLFVLFLLGGATAAYIFWPRSTLVSNTPPRNDTVSVTPSPTRNTPANNSNMGNTGKDLKIQEDELERERRKLADERKKLEDDKKRGQDEAEPNDDEPPEPPRFNDPGTTRLSFRRGSTGTTVSGTVGRRRRYVLRASEGQYLAGSVSSAGNCVSFEGGSSSVGFATGRGDNDFTVVNKCDRPSNFSLTITVR